MKITPKQREELNALPRSQSALAGHVRRARVVLLSAGGVSGQEIARMVGLIPEQVSRIRTRSSNHNAECLIAFRRRCIGAMIV